MHLLVLMVNSMIRSAPSTPCLGSAQAKRPFGCAHSEPTCAEAVGTAGASAVGCKCDERDGDSEEVEPGKVAHRHDGEHERNSRCCGYGAAAASMQQQREGEDHLDAEPPGVPVVQRTARDEVRARRVSESLPEGGSFRKDLRQGKLRDLRSVVKRVRK